MSLLVHVLETSRATSTHHRLALDALTHLGGSDSARWREMYLAYHEGYLEGAKAPDKTFKDFKNHVLHPGEKYWGGAVAATCQWYDKLVAALSDHAWEAASYAAGVMSHYYTDVWCPLHTGSSEREDVIHRAFEWSVCKSYDDLRRRLQDRGWPGVTVPVGERWLEEMVAAAAVTSFARYDEMVYGYDFEAGSSHPPDGLTETLRDGLAELLGRAAVGLARILERASDDAGVSPPEVSLTWPTVMASVKVPLYRLLARIEDAEERAALTAIYNEFKETGRVTRHLPEENHVIRLQQIEESLQRPLAGNQPAAEARNAPRPSPTPRATTAPAPSADDSSLRDKAPPQSVPKVASEAPASRTSGNRTANRLANAELVQPVSVGSVSARTSEASRVPAPRTPAAAVSRAVAGRATTEPTVRLADQAPAIWAKAQAQAASDPESLHPVRHRGVRLPALEDSEEEDMDASVSDRSSRRTLNPTRDEESSRTTSRVEKQIPSTERPLKSRIAAARHRSAEDEPESMRGPVRSSEERRSEREPSRERTDERSTRSPVPSESRAAPSRTVRHYLTLDADVVEAPSIGHKTAARLKQVGIESVRELLEGDPDDISTRLGRNGPDAETIERWQDQAQLMLTVPGLRGHDAQILVGCGYTAARQIATADAEMIALQADEFVNSAVGRRTMRDPIAPELDEVRQWIAWASSSKISRAA